MPINSSNFAKLLYPGLNSIVGDEYNEWEKQYTELFDSYTDDRNYVEEISVTGFGPAQKKVEGGSIVYDEEEQAFITRYAHTVWALGFTITREMYEDDQYGYVGPQRARKLAFSLNYTKETNGANIYNRAFNASYVGGDGVSLCNSAHPNYSGGTWSNTLAVAANLSEAALEQATIDIMKWENDRGLPVAIRARSLHIPLDLIYEAERILMSPQRVGTANNDINALYAMGKFPGGVKPNRYLTDTNAWFIRTDAPDGMKFFQRRPLEFTIDNDFETEDAKYKATERYSFGWTDPRGVYGSPGAS